MNNRRRAALLVGALAILAVGAGIAGGQPAAAPATDPAVSTPEGLVAELYGSLCLQPGAAFDAEKMRSLFLPDALLYLRATRDSSASYSIQGYIDDFIAFAERPEVQQKGYSEKIVWLKPFVFHDIAHVLVCYEAAIPGSSRPPQRGLDSLQLVRKDGRWWVASVTNDLPNADNPLPAGPKE